MTMEEEDTQLKVGRKQREIRKGSGQDTLRELLPQAPALHTTA
jgi:hypothetical protein